MERRSTNDIGYTHHQGDLTAHVGSSHGVRLSGGSTGGIVEAVGDDTNVDLILRAQGAGVVRFGASTSGFGTFERSLIQFTIPALSTDGTGPDESTTVSVTGLTTNAMCWVQQRVAYNSTVTAGVFVTGRCSTAAQLRLTFFNHAGTSLSGSTMSAYLYMFR